MDWHALLVHRLGVVRGGGVITHYRGVDGRTHLAHFCDVCGKMFDKDKPAMIGTLAESLYEAHQLDNLCARMAANAASIPWPVQQRGADFMQAVEKCKRDNGWREVAPKA